MKNKLVLFALLLTVAIPLWSQAVPVVPPVAPLVWVKITPESSTIAVTLPAGTTYRLGDYANSKWAQATTQAVTTFNPVSMGGANTFPFSDPDQGTPKELDVLEVAATQTITVSDLTLTPLAPSSRIVPGLKPATTVATQPGSTHVVTFSNFSNTSVYPPSSQLMLSLTNAPANLAYRTWEGTNMEVDIDGVALSCTYGQTYTDSAYTLNCTVPPPQ
jgi:hypothetical protein